MQNNLNENSLAHIWHVWNLEKRETQKLTKKHYNYIVAYGHNKTHVKICKNPISFIIQKVTLENAVMQLSENEINKKMQIHKRYI